MGTKQQVISEYTDKDIVVLDDRTHCRTRLPVYAGNVELAEYTVPFYLNDEFCFKTISFVPAKLKVIIEAIDNCCDEFSQLPNSWSKKLSIEFDSSTKEYTISDTGRGIPISLHSSGKYAAEVVVSQLRSGRNFKDNKQIGTIGQNGYGVSLLNFVSSSFQLIIQRDNKKYTQLFTNGSANIEIPKIKSDTNQTTTGTTVKFILDEHIFKDKILPEELIHNRAIEIALINPGVEVTYNEYKYKFKKGFEDIVKNLSTDYFVFKNDHIEFYVIFDVNQDRDEQIFSYVNSSPIYDGGVCNTQFLNAFMEKTISSLEKDAKKNKCQITKNDIRSNLLIIGNLKISDPQYDSQAKTRLTGPNLRKEMISLIEENWSLFSRRNKDWLDTVLERATIRHHKDADSDAVDEHKKGLRKKVAGLVDATSKNYFERQLLITEGLSASRMILQSRDPLTTASLPLSGKINNVYGSTVAQLLKMGKVADLLTAIGLIPGHKAIRSNLRYGKIIIASDADRDGDDITTLILNLFYQFWPELFDKNYDPIIYRLLVPNVVVSKKDKRIHFTTMQAYESQKEKYNGWTTEYMKGLGSMHKNDWTMVLSSNDYLIGIVDDGKVENTLQLLFSSDTDARKIWLTTK